MSNFNDFFFGSNIAQWQEAIGEVFGAIEDQRQAALAAIYLSTAALGELNDRYAKFTGGKPSPNWQLEVFREHLQETIQAFLMLSSTRKGVSQVVAATTMIPPVLTSIDLLKRWLLGFQYLPNRFFTIPDGHVVASIDGPYTFTKDTRLLAIRVDGLPVQSILFPVDEPQDENAIVKTINAALVSAKAAVYGQRFDITTNSRDRTGSIQVDPSSTSLTIFGLDTFLHPNAPAPDSIGGTLPWDWGLLAPEGSFSNPSSQDSALFGVNPAQLKGLKDSPFTGLFSADLIGNGSFENDFTGWDKSLGPDFYITNFPVHTGGKSLAVKTRAGVENILSSPLKPVPGGAAVTATGFQQATAPTAFSSPLVSNANYRWVFSDQVMGYANGQAGLDPVVASGVATVSLTDSTVDFVDKGIR